MTRYSKINKRLQTALCSLALAGSASYGFAQGVNDYVVSQFPADTGNWGLNYGSATNGTLTWDGTEDHGPGASPGAMKVTIDFNLCTGNIQRDFESGVLASTLDLTTYSKLHFSVKVDPNSSRLSDWGGGNFGNMRFHVRPSDWSSDVNIGSNDGNSQQWVESNAYGAWQDYAINIDHTTGLAVKSVAAILGVDIWSGWGNCAAPIGHTNTVTFWMDNIWYEKVVGPPPPPPTVDLKKAGPAGVQITMDTDGSQWQRDAIATPAAPGNVMWKTGLTNVVSYSFTIADFPAPVAHEGFEAHLFIVNRDTASAFDETYGGCDYNVPDIAIMSIAAVTNNGGEYFCQFQFKTNRPNANPLDDATHRPGSITSPDILGTWTLAFTDLTNVTMTSPGGISTNFTVPIEAVTNNFSPASSFLQFGFHKNDNENNGHNNQVSGTFSRIRKVGGEFEFDDTFNGATFTNNYAWRKTSATAVQHVPSGTAWWLSWTLPATGFYPQSASALAGPWTDILTSSYQAAGKAHVGIPAGGNDGYFRVIKRPFSKLQVLLPGETGAPNTISGKTGTPNSQTGGAPFNVTVNAVDAVWNVVGSSDTVHITSSDTGTLPADAALVQGTRTFTVTLDNVTGHTITATNVTNIAITPGVSSALP